MGKGLSKTYLPFVEHFGSAWNVVEPLSFWNITFFNLWDFQETTNLIEIATPTPATDLGGPVAENIQMQKTKRIEIREGMRVG